MHGYEIRQIPLLYVLVDLKEHNVQWHSYHFHLIDQLKRHINLFRHNFWAKRKQTNKGIYSAGELPT